MERNFTLCKISAFVDKASAFYGNGAAVCLLERWLPDKTLQSMAAKVALPETAFLVKDQRQGNYGLRWFTPEIEMDLCGHATLAAAHYLFDSHAVDRSKIYFKTSAGRLIASKESGMIVLDFPARVPEKHPLPDLILRGIGRLPIEVLKSRDYLLIYDNEEEIININPDGRILNQINLDPGGIIVSARGKAADFVSRYFTPGASIFEDPVTGSAHCSLVPYWSSRLGKKQLVAHQLSESGGKLFCTDKGSRVSLGGACLLQGEINVSLDLSVD